MNKIVCPYIHSFVLVLLDDIQIYSENWEAHLQHVDEILQILQEHHLFVKKSKCSFRMQEVEYLGHIVGLDGVKVDPINIQAMQDWPHPKTMKSLRCVS
jgi:hypothetical protein